MSYILKVCIHVDIHVRFLLHDNKCSQIMYAINVNSLFYYKHSKRIKTNHGYIFDI